MLRTPQALPDRCIHKMQGQYEWKVDQLQQHIAEQQQTCAQLKAQLQAAHKVIILFLAYTSTNGRTHALMV